MRPLREVFDRLVAQDGAAGGLDPAGHAELAPELLAEALVGYCDTTSIEVAEHLEGFVTATTAQLSPDLATGLDLLTSAPVPDGPPLTDPLLGSDGLLGGDPMTAGTRAAEDTTDDEPEVTDLGFGTGTTEVVLPDLTAVPGVSAADEDLAEIRDLAEVPDPVGDETGPVGADTWFELPETDAETEPPPAPEDDTTTE